MTTTNQKKFTTSRSSQAPFDDRTRVLGVESGLLPPQAVDFEEAALGAMMLEPSAIESVIHVLSCDMFYGHKHSVMYDAIVQLYNRKEPVDMLTVTNFLRNNGALEEVGGAHYIAQLTMRVLSAAHLEFHAAIIFQKFVQREIIRISAETMRVAYFDEQDVDDTFTQLERQVSTLGEMNAGKKKSRDFREILNDCLAEAWQRHENYHKGKENGIKSGFCDLDKITNGWQNSDFIVLAARPSMGKTAVSLKFALKAAAAGTPVVLFSLEMKDTQLVHRMLLSGVDISADNYRSGATNVEDMQQIESRVGKICDYPITIDQSAGVNMSYIRAQSKVLKKQGKCGLILIDYLQLIKEEGNSGRNREQAMSAISGSCKHLAIELNVPVIALSQLNRDCEKRSGDGKYKPILADLRDSGAIEQDADMVIFVHRPEKFGQKAVVDGSLVENYGELIVSKQRNGSLGMVKFTHNGSMTEFYDWDKYGSKGYDVF